MMGTGTDHVTVEEQGEEIAEELKRLKRNTINL